MQTDYFEIGFSGISFIFVYYLFMVAISYWQKFPFAKDLLVGSLRATIQLSVIGYVLHFVFKFDNPLSVCLMLAVMIGVAAFDANQRQELFKNGMLPVYFLTGIVFGFLLTIVFMLAFVLKLEPWYHPRFLIPISGMLIGNAMNSLSIAIKGFNTSLKDNLVRIETAISLGANPYQAVRELLVANLHLALVPKINSLMITGLVQLPGMMSGQIIGGASPFSAVKYQLVILLGIVISAFAGSWLGLYLNFRRFFDPFWRLREFVYYD